MTTPTVIGVDLSLTATGISTAARTWTITTSPKDSDDMRMDDIACAVIDCLVDGGLVVIEGGSSHGTTAFRLGGLHYVVRHELLRCDIQFAIVAPATLKKFATGKGNATKPDMRMALYKRTGLDLADDNQVDAAWLRYAGLARLGRLPFDLPAAQLAALDKATWYREATA